MNILCKILVFGMFVSTTVDNVVKYSGQGSFGIENVIVIYYCFCNFRG